MNVNPEDEFNLYDDYEEERTYYQPLITVKREAIDPIVSETVVENTEIKCPECADGFLRAHYISSEEFIMMCRPKIKRTTGIHQKEKDVSNLISLASTHPAV